MNSLQTILATSSLVTAAFVCTAAPTSQGGQRPDRSPFLPATSAFDIWLKAQQEKPSISRLGDRLLLEDGLRLARQRAGELRGLMERDPEEFLKFALPETRRAGLPPQLQPFIEQRVKGRGSLLVSCALPVPLQPGEEPLHGKGSGFHYDACINGVAYKAFVFGKWRKQRTVREATLEGVTLGDFIVLGDAPTPDEQVAGGEPVLLDAPNTSGANTLLYMIAQFSDESSDPIDDATALSQMAMFNTFWLNNSAGTVSIQGRANPGQVMDIVHIRLPRPMSYGATYNRSNISLILSDARNAATALGYNYANYNLDVVVTSNQGFDYAGRAVLYGQGAHFVAPYTTLRTSGHELGHNLGLYHANYWRTDSLRPYGRDSIPGGYVSDVYEGEWLEYGHYFSIMGAQSGSDIEDPTKPHYAPAEKVELGWLSGSQVQYVTSSGTYRLFRLDHRDTTGVLRGIRIETPATDYTGNDRKYWLSYRYAPWATAQSWFRNGLQVEVGPWGGYDSPGAIMLDMTPYSKDAPLPFFDKNNKPGNWWTIDNSDKVDGALVVGRTYSDRDAGIHLSPVATGNNGVNEEYIDVVVHLGRFPGNRPPVISAFSASTNHPATGQVVNFSVTANDPDGDALAYAWNFDEVQVWTQSGLNSPTAVKSWPNAGHYRVTVTVSDMKGGVATESLIVTVGVPANDHQIWGRIIWAGQPVSGARVWCTNGATVYQAWSDSDGTYVLTDLPATNDYMVKCQWTDATFTNQFTNPVSVAAGNAYGMDFYAKEPLPKPGAFIVSGRVTYAGGGVFGAEVRCGGLVALTDYSGNYQFTNLPAGTYALRPTYETWAFSPASRTLTLSTNDSSGNDFARVAPYTLSGRIDGAPAGAQDRVPTVSLSNGRAVQASRQDPGGTPYWSYTLPDVPAGQYSVSAELYNYRVMPSGFSNPLIVTGDIAGLNFTATSARVDGAIWGRITELGLALSGATVAAQKGGTTVASAVTDSDGYYRIMNVTNGSYTLVPSLAGYSFSPPTRSIGSIYTYYNFTASGSNMPPSITSLQASPSVVPDASGTATLSAAANGNAPLSFSWDAVTARAPVNFSTNDSAGAASTVVSFQAAGSYTFRVRVTDSLGFSTVSNVNVTVMPRPFSMAVSPYEVRVESGGAVAFRAYAWDELGNRITVSPTWSLSAGGSISTGGVFTAATPGGPYAVSAVADSLSATGYVWVAVSSQLPLLSVTALSAGGLESGTNAGIFRISRGGGTNQAVTVNLAVQGTATYLTDYLVTGADSFNSTAASITLAAGETNRNLFVTPVDDNLMEGNETVTLTLQTNAAYTLDSSTNATVTIQDDEAPAAIVTHPQNLLVTEGSNAIFTVVATGTPPPGYQWMFNSTNLIPGATNDVLVLTNVQDANAGFYLVAVSNGVTAVSSNAELLVNHRPVPASPTVQRYPGASVKVRESELLGIDPDGDSLFLSSVSPESLLGGLVSTNEGWVYYHPPADLTNDDYFGYTVGDGRGGFSPGTVIVAVSSNQGPSLSIFWDETGGGAVRLVGRGIAEQDYGIEFAETLENPEWQPLAVITADQFGLFGCVDRPSVGMLTRFYRVRCQ